MSTTNMKYFTKYFKDPANHTQEKYINALKKNGNVLQFILNQTEDMCMLAILHSPDRLRYVMHQTEPICLIAVKLNGLTLEFVKPDLQTDAVVNAAIKKNPYALQYVINQTP